MKTRGCPHPFPFVFHRTVGQVDADEARAASKRKAILVTNSWYQRLRRVERARAK